MTIVIVVGKLSVQTLVFCPSYPLPHAYGAEITRNLS